MHQDQKHRLNKRTRCGDVLNPEHFIEPGDWVHSDVGRLILFGVDQEVTTGDHYTGSRH